MQNAKLRFKDRNYKTVKFFSQLFLSHLSPLTSQFSTRRGFTLIELLVVVSIIAIISSFGFAGMVTYSRRQAVEQGAADVKTAIEKTKFMAVSRVKPELCEPNPVADYHLHVCVMGGCGSDPPPPVMLQREYQTWVDADIGGGVINGCGPPAYSRGRLPQNVIFDVGNSTCGETIGFLPLSSTLHSNPIVPGPPSFPPGGCQIAIRGYNIIKYICINSSGHVTVQDTTC